MKKTDRIEMLKMIISSKELSSQEEVLQELKERRYKHYSGNTEQIPETASRGKSIKHERIIRVCVA